VLKNDKNNEVTGLRLEGEDTCEEIEADLVIFGAGVKPVTSFMIDTSFERGSDG